MEIEIIPSVSLQQGTFNVLVAPPGMLIEALNSRPEIQRFKLLYVTGNYSRILSGLNRNIREMDVRRAFTAYQLLTVLEENHHTLLIIEHDPMLYQDEPSLQEYISKALREVASQGRAIVLLYSAAMDRSLEEISAVADRLFSFNVVEKQTAARRPSRAKAGRLEQTSEGQLTLGAF
jgi:DNA polymerase I